MPRLSADEFRNLKAVLLDAFNTTAYASDLVREARNLSLDRAGLGRDLDEVMTNLIGRAQSELWLPDLVAAAIRLRPESEPLRSLRLQWRELLEAQSDPYKALMLPGRMVFIDRVELRDSLASLDRDPLGPRVLVVDGADKSGKTYSVHLISYISAVRQTFRCAYVDLQRLPKNASGQVDAFALGAGVSTALLGATYPPPADKNLNTWIDGYCSWLETNLSLPGRRPGTYWIVIDHFRKVGTDSTSLDLVAQIAMRTYLDLSSIRLVLLNYGDPDWLQARVTGVVQREVIPVIDRMQLARFFSEFHTQEVSRLGEPVEQAALIARVRESVTKVMSAPPEDGVSPLEHIGRAAWNEIQRVRRPSAVNDPLDELARAALESDDDQGNARGGS